MGALEDTQGLVSIERAHALLAAAELSSAITDFDYGLQCVQQAQALFMQLSDQWGEIDARLKHCELSELAGNLVDLQAQAEEALRMAEGISYTPGTAKGKYILASIAYHAGEFETAIQYALPSVALWRELENPFELAAALNRLAGVWRKSTNMLQLNKHERNAGISTCRWVTGAASPQSFKIWDSSLNALETILVPGHYSVMHCEYATI